MLKKWLKVLLVVLIVIFVGMQFVRPTLTNPPVDESKTMFATGMYVIAADMRTATPPPTIPGNTRRAVVVLVPLAGKPSMMLRPSQL